MLSSLRDAGKKGRIALVFIESPANPTNALVDFEALNRVLDIIESETGHRPISVCDNTLMGPIFQQAVPQGIDMAMYSLTKYVGGHSDLSQVLSAEVLKCFAQFVLHEVFWASTSIHIQAG